MMSKARYNNEVKFANLGWGFERMGSLLMGRYLIYVPFPVWLDSVIWMGYVHLCRVAGNTV